MLLLLHGTEPYLIHQRVRELKEEADKKSILIENIDCTEANIQEVLSGLNTPSLFDSKKLFILRDPFLIKEFEGKEAQDIFKKANLHILVFIGAGEKKTSPLFKFLVRYGKQEEFLKIKGIEQRNWALREIKKYGNSFGPGALEALLFSCGDDLTRLSKEIEKLATFLYSSKNKHVTKDDVSLLVGETLEPKIFSTIDAISTRNRTLATKLLAGHLLAGESPIQLLSMFAWQFRILLFQRDFLERNMPTLEIAKKLKLHPFVFEKSLRAAKQFSLKELRELYKRIFSLDVALKTGKGNPDQLLHLFVASAASKKTSSD